MTTVHPHPSTVRQAASTTRAIRAVASHAVAVLSRGTVWASSPTSSTSPSGLPSVSATVNGTISAAASAQTNAAAAAERTAR